MRAERQGRAKAKSREPYLVSASQEFSGNQSPEGRSGFPAQSGRRRLAAPGVGAPGHGARRLPALFPERARRTPDVGLGVRTGRLGRPWRAARPWRPSRRGDPRLQAAWGEGKEAGGSAGPGCGGEKGVGDPGGRRPTARELTRRDRPRRPVSLFPKPPTSRKSACLRGAAGQPGGSVSGTSRVAGQTAARGRCAPRGAENGQGSSGARTAGQGGGRGSWHWPGLLGPRAAPRASLASLSEPSALEGAGLAPQQAPHHRMPVARVSRVLVYFR